MFLIYIISSQYEILQVKCYQVETCFFVIFYQFINISDFRKIEMKGIPIQLQGIINFIEMTLQNRTLSQTYQCYLLNLEKAALDTLKVANIAFENLDKQVPIEIRMLFQKTTAKIREYIKNKPKGDLEIEEKYMQEFDEIQDYLENRPEIERTNERERGELYKFLNQAEEKEKENKLLLQNIPKFSYGNFAQQHRNYFSDIRTLLESHHTPNRIRASRMLQNGNKRQFDNLRRMDKGLMQPIKHQNAEIQTDLTMAALDQLLRRGTQSWREIQFSLSNDREQSRRVSVVCKKRHQNTTEQLTTQKSQVNIVGTSQNQLGIYQSKKKATSRKELYQDDNMRQSQFLEGNQNNCEGDQNNNQELQLTKLEIKDKKSQNKSILKGKSNDKREGKSKKKESAFPDSTFKKNKNMDDNQSSRNKRTIDIRESFGKSEKFIQKLNKIRAKENFTDNRVSINILQNQTKLKGVQVQTQTENLEGDLQILKGVQSVKKKSNSLQKIESLSQIHRNKQRKTKDFSKRDLEQKKTLNDSSKTKNETDTIEKVPKINSFQDPVHQVHEGTQYSVLPSLVDKMSKSSKYDIFTSNIPNFSSSNLRESTDSKDLRKTKINLSQFHQSMHLNLCQNVQERYSNHSSYKTNQKSIQLLPAIRQDEEALIKNRDKTLSKDKEDQLEKENKRLLEQIQTGTAQKKGRKVEWMKVIRDIRQYEHLHFKYCGQNCVHLVKFYEFLKKKNLSMYINRKQLYVHKHNIEIKPNLL